MWTRIHFLSWLADYSTGALTGAVRKNRVKEQVFSSHRCGCVKLHWVEWGSAVAWGRISVELLFGGDGQSLWENSPEKGHNELFLYCFPFFISCIWMSSKALAVVLHLYSITRCEKSLSITSGCDFSSFCETELTIWSIKPHMSWNSFHLFFFNNWRWGKSFVACSWAHTNKFLLKRKQLLHTDNMVV